MVDQVYLRASISNADVLLDLTPEELGALIIEAIKRSGNNLNLPGNVRASFYPEVGDGFREFPVNHRHNISQAILEAWSWLEAQGFLVGSDDINGRNGYRTLTRRARRIQPDEFPNFAAARTIPSEIIHESIRTRVWSNFVRGNYASAVFEAARQLEVSVRTTAGLGNDVVGTDLMRQAFRPNNGPLTDMNTEAAEREAMAHLFAGFYGAYRNPLAHRDINIDDPIEAMELVMTVSHLLRIVDARRPVIDHE